MTWAPGGVWPVALSPSGRVVASVTCACPCDVADPSMAGGAGDVTVRRCVSVPLASTAVGRHEGKYTSTAIPT